LPLDLKRYGYDIFPRGDNYKIFTFSPTKLQRILNAEDIKRRFQEKES
jgi:hypothetical protein